MNTEAPDIWEGVECEGIYTGTPMIFVQGHLSVDELLASEPEHVYFTAEHVERFGFFNIIDIVKSGMADVTVCVWPKHIASLVEHKGVLKFAHIQLEITGGVGVEQLKPTDEIKLIGAPFTTVTTQMTRSLKSVPSDYSNDKPLHYAKNGSGQHRENSGAGWSET